MPVRRRRRIFLLEPEQVEQVYQFICQYSRQFGYSPSLKEIGDACFMAKPSVYRYLDCLQAQGRISRDSRRARSIIIIDPCKG
jgi:SOS-response transcriptional repressor LexA